MVPRVRKEEERDERGGERLVKEEEGRNIRCQE